MKTITKRDGREVPFDRSKIVNAILAAFKEVDHQITPYAEDKATNIADYIEDIQEPLNVENIQDLVENGLMSTKRKDVAKAYIKYRVHRNEVRQYNSDFMKEVSKKLNATDVQNQNANVDEYSFGGRMGEANRTLTKEYALNHCMSEKSKMNHINNYIYIHDLDSYAVGMHNCLTIPFDKLLAEGFNTRQTDVRPANSVGTAFQLVAVIFQLQSLQQFGGVSASHIDWTMVPYVRKSFYKHFKDGLDYIEDDYRYWDNFTMSKLGIENEVFKKKPKAYKYAYDMTVKEIHQAVEGMYHNLNTLQSRSGNQLPFTSINYGTCTLPEGRLITKEILNVSIEGLGALHKTSIFPCGIFQCMKGVNRKPEDPNYDLFRLALKSTAKRLYPNYVNIDWSTNAGYDRNDPCTYVSTMGCRTYNGSDINAEPGTNPQTKDGRGNIAPVTILLPFLAMEAKEKAKENLKDSAMTIMNYDDYKEDLIVNIFFGLLDTKLFEARDMLKERYEWICHQSAASAQFMYENGTMLGFKPEEGIRSAMKHGTLVIGQIGLAETLQILIGEDHTTKKGMELAKRIEGLYKERCAYFKEKEHLNFGVYYTPAENLCYTAMKKFQQKYGTIEKVSDHDYFTNSIHVPVWYQISPFDKIDIESQLTGYSNAGCITYVELESSVIKNIDALEELVNYAMDKDIPYFAINVPNDTCLECGYTGEFNDKCPVCGSEKIQQLRRVTGYLTGNYKTAFNAGKQEEVEQRVKHTGYME